MGRERDGIEVAGDAQAVDPALRRPNYGGVSLGGGPAPMTTAEPITTLGRLGEALDALNGSVEKLDGAVSTAHTKLYGPYNFPPVSEAEEAIEPEGMISGLTARVRGIERRVRGTLEIAESTEAQS